MAEWIACRPQIHIAATSAAGFEPACKVSIPLPVFPPGTDPLCGASLCPGPDPNRSQIATLRASSDSPPRPVRMGSTRDVSCSSPSLAAQSSHTDLLSLLGRRSDLSLSGRGPGLRDSVKNVNREIPVTEKATKKSHIVIGVTTASGAVVS